MHEVGSDRGWAARQHRWGLGLSVERAGLIALRFPIAACAMFVLMSIAAVFGIQRLKVDDSLSALFRSASPEFQRYEAVTRGFPSSEFDVLVVIEGNGLLNRSSVEKLREFVTELQLVDGVRGVISLFSARQPPEGGAGTSRALFPEPLPEGPAYDRLVEQVKANEILRGKLVSEDGNLALIVMAIEPEVTRTGELRNLVAETRKLAAENLEAVGLSAQLSGVPIMQLEIRTAVERDRLLYNALGFLAGSLIAILFFRRVSLMLVAVVPPLIAILLSLGLLGWLDFRLNMFLNVMTPLIMVISFSDTMQLTFAARDRLIRGEAKRDAIRNTILSVGPACVLTHGTAGLSFIALQYSDSDLIRTFGAAGLIATAVALVTVLCLFPVLGCFLIRDKTDWPKIRAGDAGLHVLRRFCAFIAATMVSRPGLYSATGFLVVAGLGLVYLDLEPRYRLADQVPDQRLAVQASGRLDAKLAGANPIDVLVEFPRGAQLFSPETLAVIADVHQALEGHPGVGNVWSVETLRRWLAQRPGLSDIATLKRYVDLLPAHLTGRFVSREQDAVIVTGRVPDVDASQLLPVVEQLDRSLAAVRAKHPGYGLTVTGLASIAARNSAAMIGKLNQALTIEVIFVTALIGAAFRSLRIMFISILPAVFPVVAAGAVLWVLGQGLQFASVIALTVSFGLGLSATIHFLNRLRTEHSGDVTAAEAVAQATVLVGPALILTTVVLACGLGMTVFSDLPSLRLFGWLSALSMLAALCADLLILRPLTMLALTK